MVVETSTLQAIELVYCHEPGSLIDGPILSALDRLHAASGYFGLSSVLERTVQPVALKQALSETLTKMPWFSGRLCRDESGQLDIECSNRGALVAMASTATNLEQLMTATGPDPVTGAMGDLPATWQHLPMAGNVQSMVAQQHPLLMGLVTQLSGGGSVLTLVAHHCLCDLTGLQVVAAHWCAAYNALLQRRQLQQGQQHQQTFASTAGNGNSTVVTAPDAEQQGVNAMMTPPGLDALTQPCATARDIIQTHAAAGLQLQEAAALQLQEAAALQLQDAAGASGSADGLQQGALGAPHPAVAPVQADSTAAATVAVAAAPGVVEGAAAALALPGGGAAAPAGQGQPNDRVNGPPPPVVCSWWWERYRDEGAAQRASVPCPVQHVPHTWRHTLSLLFNLLYHTKWRGGGLQMRIVRVPASRLAELKRQANQELGAAPAASGEGPQWVSTGDALGARVMQVLQSLPLRRGGPLRVAPVIDMRRRLDPPLPAGHLHNFVHWVPAEVAADREGTLGGLACHMRDCVRNAAPAFQTGLARFWKLLEETGGGRLAYLHVFSTDPRVTILSATGPLGINHWRIDYAAFAFGGRAPLRALRLGRPSPNILSPLWQPDGSIALYATMHAAAWRQLDAMAGGLCI